MNLNRSWIKFLTVWLACGGAPKTLTAHSYTSPMLPLKEERLETPVSLTRECQEVTIVEWRSSTNQVKPNASYLIDAWCQKAVSYFKPFVLERGFETSSVNSFTQSISIIPIDDKYRNLNDIKFRFVNRSKEYDENGEVIPILGYHQRSANFIYIFNEIYYNSQLNTQWITVWVHEMFHALSYHYGVYHQHSGNKDRAEENLAMDFTQELGLGR